MPTLPAETPIKTLATAFGAFSLLTDEAAAVNAIETYTGCKNAGKARAISNMVKLEVSIKMILLNVKISNANNITFLRFIPEKSRGVTDADRATTKAKMIPNTPIVRINTSNAPERRNFFVDGLRAW